MARFQFDPVPTVAPTGAPGNDYEHIPTSPAMFGGLIAEGEQKLGQGLESAGNAGLDYLRTKQALTNEISASETNTWLAKNLTDKFNAFGQLTGKAAQDALPQFKQDTEDLYQQSIKNAGGNLQMQAMLARSGRYLTDRYYQLGTSHADTQWRSWQAKTFDDRATEFGNQAAVMAQHGTWDDVDVALDTSDDEVRKKLEAQHLDRDSISAEVARRRGQNVKTIVETLSNNGDPRTAQAVFDKYEKGMDAGSRLAVTSHLKTLNAQLDGRDIADEETGRKPRGAPPAPIADMPASFVGAIKREEGYNAKPFWDVHQWTSGYGTKASGPDERVDQAEHEKRFQNEVKAEAKIVDGVNPNLDPGTRAALISLTHNTGEAWTHSGLGEKIRSGDLAGAKPLFLQYGNVAGQPNAAIEARRYREAQWFGQAEAPAGGPQLDKAVVYDRILARTADNPLLQNAAVARMNQIFSIERAEQTQGRVLFDQRAKDEKAEAFDSGALSTKTPLTENDFVQRYGLAEGQEKYREHADDIDLGAKIAAAASMTPEQRNELIPQPQPGPGYARALTRRAQFDTAIRQLDEQRKSDPAGLALKHLPDVRASYQGMAQVENDPKSTDEQKKAARANFAAVMRDEQSRIGIEPQDRRLLPKASIDHLNQRFAAAADSDDPQARAGLIASVQNEARLWGDSWPDVAKQLAPMTQPIVKAIADGADPGAMARLLRLPKDENPAKVLKEQDEVKAKELNTQLNAAFAPFAATLLPAQRDLDGQSYYGLAEKLSALYVRDGSSASEAATKAVGDLIGGQYDFRGSLRIPKELHADADQIEHGAYQARTALATFGAVPPHDDLPGRSNAAADDLAAVARDGIWITAPDHSGATLYYAGKAVRTADGKPLLVPWAELARRGQADFATALESAPNIQRNMLTDYVGGIFGASKAAAPAAVYRPDNPNYPSKDDAAFARQYQYAYGKPWEPFFNNETARILGTSDKKGNYSPASASGLSTTETLKALDTPSISKIIDLKDPKNAAARKDVEDGFARAALGTGRHALAALGFNPDRTLLDIVTKRANIGGLTNSGSTQDQMYVNDSAGNWSTIVHESVHNGIKKVLAADPGLSDRMKKAGSGFEEYAVRHVMDTVMGNPEEGAGAAGDSQIRESRNVFKNYSGSANLKLLDDLTRKAEELIGQQRGPR